MTAEGKQRKTTQSGRQMKRLRGTAEPEKVFRTGLLADSQRESLKKEYDASGPYHHVVIKDLVADDLLRRVRAELLAIHATRKETDIYRVFQTGDMANLDGLPEHELTQLKSLLQLRNALYSHEFRTYIASICGVGKLSPSKADLSHNIYKEGCHLLCHDDVIGTRSISYIIYLTDPEDPWRESDGGGLELFPVVSKGTPAVHPSVVIPPAWNQMCMFAVQPGHSFHSVAEVVSVDRTRPSISGWFHVLQPEDMSDEELAAYEREKLNSDGNGLPKASLDQLLSGDSDFPFKDLPKFSIKGPEFDDEEVEMKSGNDEDDEEEGAPLTESEIAFLKPFINPSYLNPKVISQANDRFCEDSSIQLTSFLEPSLAAAISKATQSQDKKDGLLTPVPRPATQPAPIANYNAGVSRDWVATGPSHKHRFLQLMKPSGQPLPQTPTLSTQDPSMDLATLEHVLFSSKPFLRLINLITSLKPTASRSQARRFRPGMDYTLATTSGESSNDPDSEVGVLDATLCFVCERDGQDAGLWESDEVGGFDCYMAADESNDDPAQYRAQRAVKAAYTGTAGSAENGEEEDMEGAEGDGGALLSVSAKSNCLSLVMREASVMRFIKYVGARAPGSRWDVAVEYKYE
ncbi:hypothetical protein HDU78_002846 [Chytriomyces hyalinus]|nr:hypothetical protein HDU78_002846 [Chytriomyces hyalinus]